MGVEVQSWAPAAGGRFHISRRLGGGVRAQVRHKDFPAVPGCPAGYLFLVNGGNVGKLYVFNGTQNFVFYRTAAKRVLADLQRLEPNHLQPYPVIVEHGWRHNAGAEYLGYYNMGYHLYVIPKSVELQDAISFEYG